MTGNIQYLRTDRAIQSAMLSLLGRKSFDKITVQDILEETPISRATFYKHFRDKYEIVEKIQDEILHTHKQLRVSLDQASPEQYPALMERFTTRNKEISQLVMKVETDRINLPLALVGESEAYYLTTSDSPNRELEAKVYAAAATAMTVAMLEEKQDYPLEHTFDAMIAVGLRLMGVPNDPDLKQRILRHRRIALQG